MSNQINKEVRKITDAETHKEFDAYRELRTKNLQDATRAYLIDILEADPSEIPEDENTLFDDVLDVVSMVLWAHNKPLCRPSDEIAPCFFAKQCPINCVFRKHNGLF